MFGEQFLQIGSWGGHSSFLRYARTQRRALLDWRTDSSADVISDPEELGIASDSIDAVLLPHTLERTESPHALLREVDRILSPTAICSFSASRRVGSGASAISSPAVASRWAARG